MQADLKTILETVKGNLVGPEWIHESVDMAFLGADPNEITVEIYGIVYEIEVNEDTEIKQTA